MPMKLRNPVRLALAALALAATAQPVLAQQHHGGGGNRPAPAEPQHMPRGYDRPVMPQGAPRRPDSFDAPYFRHNFRAERGFAIGPYHAPPRMAYRHWVYGDILPSIFWAQNYWLSDYWLFGLDVPPVGYEWVRYWNDAVLIDVQTGEIVQVVYGLFL